jgi:pyridoxamine 5'-phosphate oxidase
VADAPEFAQPLRERDVDPDPFRQFAVWFVQAGRSGVRMPEAAALATATPDGMPSVRMVLVKETGPRGFVFYSNFDSRKGRELAANPRGALLFYWEPAPREPGERARFPAEPDDPRPRMARGPGG